MQTVIMNVYFLECKPLLSVQKRFPGVLLSKMRMNYTNVSMSNICQNI